MVTDLLACVVFNNDDKCRYNCVISVDKIEKGTELFTEVDIEKIGEYYFVGSALKLEKVEHE
jgi:hypothetical protein